MTLLNPHFYRAAFGSIISLVLFSSPSWADLTSGPFTSAPSTTMAGSYSTILKVPAFQANLGTLDYIQLTLTITGSTSIDIINKSMGAQAFSDAYASVPIEVNGPQGLEATIEPFSGFVPTGIANGATTVNGVGETVIPGNPMYTETSSTIPATFTPGQSGISFSSTTPGALVTIPISFTTGSGPYSGFGPSGLLFFGGIGDSSATATVEYFYLNSQCGCTSIPEPSSTSLVATSLGVLMVFLLARRRWVAVS